MLSLSTFILFVEKSGQKEAAFLLGQRLPCPEAPHLPSPGKVPVVPEEKKLQQDFSSVLSLSVVLPQNVNFEI